MLDAQWVVQIYSKDADGDLCIGTGYLITDKLVLTARHVIFSDDVVSSELKLVFPERDKDGKLKKKGENYIYDLDNAIPFDSKSIMFPGSNQLDLAAIRCPKDLQPTPPMVKLAIANPSSNTQWETRGFPKAGKVADFQREQLGFIVNRQGMKTDSIFELHTDVNLNQNLFKTENGWGGLSGSPVFFGNELVAVITDKYETLDSYFYAVSIPYLLRTNNDFKKAVGFQTESTLVPKPILGEDFKKFLHDQISAELKRSEAECIKQQLARYLGHDEEDSALIHSVATSLLDCDVDAAIRDYLTLAAVDCLCPIGERYRDVGEKLTLTRKVAEQILGWLVLASIDENQIEQIFPCCSQHESLFFALAVDSFAGAEIVLSRRFAHSSVWPDKESENPKGRFAISSQDSWFKWKEEEVVRKILLEIWNTVFPAPEARKKADQELNEGEIKTLNATLRSRRIKPRDNEHYYIAFKLPEQSSAFAEIIYQQVLKNLPQMTVVQFGIKGSDSLFLIPEEYVTTEVSEFYKAISKLN